MIVRNMCQQRRTVFVGRLSPQPTRRLMKKSSVLMLKGLSQSMKALTHVSDTNCRSMTWAKYVFYSSYYVVFLNCVAENSRCFYVYLSKCLKWDRMASGMLNGIRRLKGMCYWARSSLFRIFPQNVCFIIEIKHKKECMYNLLWYIHKVS